MHIESASYVYVAIFYVRHGTYQFAHIDIICKFNSINDNDNVIIANDNVINAYDQITC